MDRPYAKLYSNLRCNHLTSEENTQAKLRHKKMVLEERLKRIQQPRATSIAVDKEGIQKQIEERIKEKSDEEFQTKFFENLLQKSERLHLQEELKLSKENQKEKAYFANFWKLQKEEKERDIYIKSDADLKSYGLRFCGEDPHLEVKLIMKKNQTKEILEDQIKSKGDQNSLKEKNERECILADIRQQEHFKQLHEENKRRKDMEKESLRKANEELIVTKTNERIKNMGIEKKMQNNHIKHFMNSSFLTEDPCVSKSIYSPNRILTDRWKGMTVHEKEHFKIKLLEQIRENQEREKKNEIFEKACEVASGALNHESEKLHIKNEHLKKNRENSLMLENQLLAETQRNQRAIQEKERNFNQITDDFFKKFGRHAR